MRHSDFVPLHLHTEYSLLDGAIRIKELMAAASEHRMPAVAMTDHGGMFGAVDFYFSAVKAGIKPILGCEVYVAPEDHRKKGDQKPYHLILLARDNDGYKNLITLVSESYLHGFYKKPRIDKALLEQYSGGLIGLSACLQGEVPQRILQGNMDAAREAALEYRRILGADNFFLELQDNGIEEQDTVNKGLIQLSGELHIGLVATNDCHYLKESDVKAHEVLLCIQTGRTMSDETRFRFRGSGYYFRSPEEMKESFSHVPEAIENTLKIAERCNVEFPEGEALLPRVATDVGALAYGALDHQEDGILLLLPHCR
jgi:DNA polymerase-3 subunit alpha